MGSRAIESGTLQSYTIGSDEGLTWRVGCGITRAAASRVLSSRVAGADGLGFVPTGKGVELDTGII
jgi:hypothetical protein